MSALQARLGPARCARIHRSCIVRLDHIQELQVSRDGQCTAILRDGTRLRVGRAYRAGLEQQLERRMSVAS
jgi:two-component system LytT family response regulator